MDMPEEDPFRPVTSFTFDTDAMDGKGLSPESEGPDIKEVVKTADFACCVRLKGEQGILLIHACPIVRDLYHPLAAVEDLYLDLAASGIYSIFNELF